MICTQLSTFRYKKEAPIHIEAHFNLIHPCLILNFQNDRLTLHSDIIMPK